jgi:hypothetical protein
MVCSRVIDLRLPKATSAGQGKGGSGAKEKTVRRDELVMGTGAARAAVHGLQEVHGWAFTAAPHGSWHACRTVGWWLDAHAVCASVTVRGATAVLTLDVASDWLALLP